MSLSPKYTITNKILFNIKEITKLVVELNSKKLAHVMYSELFENTKTLGVKELSLSLEESKNYTKALEKFNKKNTEFTTNLILSIHCEAMQGLSSKNHVGKFRNNGIKKNVKNLVKFVNSERADTDSLILASLFYKQFCLLEPFVHGTERISILATRVLLLDLDMNLFNLLNFEKIGGVKTKDNTKWIEYFTEVILNEMLRVKKKVNNVAFKQDIDLNQDQKRVLKYLEKNGVITDSEYSKITERKKATRVLDFNRLIERGLIERCGQGRQTHYILK